MSTHTTAYLILAVPLYRADYMDEGEEPDLCLHADHFHPDAKFCAVCGQATDKTKSFSRVHPEIVPLLSGNYLQGELEAGGDFDCDGTLGGLRAFNRERYSDESLEGPRYLLGQLIHEEDTYYLGATDCPGPHQGVDTATMTERVQALRVELTRLSSTIPGINTRDIRLYLITHTG